MKFKNTKKTTSSKETAPSKSKEVKETALKEEIREIVEETVQEVLKEKADKEELPLSAPEESHPVPEKPESVHAEVVTEDNHEQITETPPVVQPQEIPVMQHVSTEVNTETNTSVVDQTPEEAKPEVSPRIETTPVASVSGNSVPESDNDITETTEEVTKKSSFLRIFILLLVLLLLIGGGYWYASSANLLPGVLSGPSTQQNVTPSQVPVATATPTQAAVDLSTYKISVLNGSGVPGQAASVKSDLTDAGFTVTNTGNADSTDVTDTIISAKSSVEKAYIEKLTKALEKTYVVSSDIKSLDDSESADVVITIGSNTK